MWRVESRPAMTPSDRERLWKAKQKERAGMEVKEDGSIVLMTKAEERAWRKKTKTVIRNKP